MDLKQIGYYLYMEEQEKEEKEAPEEDEEFYHTPFSALRKSLNFPLFF